MRRQAIHYQVSDRPACGISPYRTSGADADMTRDKGKVTCKNCRKKKAFKEETMPDNSFVIEITVRYDGPELGQEDKEGILNAAVQAAANALPDSVENNGTDGVIVIGS